MSDLLYRYEDVTYATPFDDTGHMPGETKAVLRTFEIVRRTAKTLWIAPAGWTGFLSSVTRRMNATARRRYAWSTIEEARVSFLARKRWQIRILRAQIASVEAAIADLDRSAP